MKVGDLVLIVGKLDTRVRDNTNNGEVYGTLDQILVDNQVSVLLDGGDIYVGPMHSVVLEESR